MNLTTFSIVARCARTGELGVTVSTKVPAVGSLCTFVRSGVGAVATQAWVNPYLGPRVLNALASGLSAELAIQQALGSDVEYAIRQLGAIGANGPGAAFTGLKTDPWKGHRTGADYAVQGNMLVGEETIAAMADAFVASSAESLAERLLRALEAGQAAGGDRRGRQSAAMQVFGAEDYPLVDLRVDEHRDPVAELRRIFEVAKVELFPLVAALPTKRNPRGNFDSIHAAVAPKK
ncbi:MAG: DUF1028 domain-containing protein [Candidatus Binatus sp.]|uniref:DUF1028 domain-containing protein n=1 Tax=Candidatus Binatus sp. TaxID=2811406 RepID=UPI002722FA29|nr:DUF1028 domain-containing protein [Candidatus Binatus sp.]MDO8431740.1 DUF1028 domain-containing protein [Candidatus Binatus sp.]